MEIDNFDYYSDQNGMVHCGYHIDKKAKYINISQICDVTDRLLCQECCIFLKKHTQTFEEESFVDIDDIFDENYRFQGFKNINKQLEQLSNLEKVQSQYMDEMERFYDDIKREVNEQIDQCKKKMLSLFNIQLDQQNIFKEYLVQLSHFDSFRYFVRTMNTHSLQCLDIELFIQEQYRLTQVLEEITQNYIYSTDMISFFSQIEQLKKIKRTNKLKDLINDLSIQQNFNQSLTVKNYNQHSNSQLLEQIQEIDAKLLPFAKRKDSLDEQLQQIEKQKQRVMEIQQETFEECDMFFLNSIQEQNRNIKLERQIISKQNHLGQIISLNTQMITIPPQIQCQIFCSSPLINSYTYEFNLEFLNQPSGECVVGLVQENKKNQQIPQNLSKIIYKNQENQSKSNSSEYLLRSPFIQSSLLYQPIQLNLRVNISKKSLTISNQNDMQNVELANISNQTCYRLAISFKEFNGVKLVY